MCAAAAAQRHYVMQQKRILSPRFKAALLFLGLWFLVVIVAFPVVVLALGFRLHEGWDFLIANPKFSIIFGGLPVFCILLAWMVEVKNWLRRRRAAA